MATSGAERYHSLEIVGDAGVGKGQKGGGVAGSEGTQQTDHDV